MPKGRDLELRRDILAAFNKQVACSLQDINKYLKTIKNPKPEHTIRYTVNAMVKEGLLKQSHRGNKNRAFYTRESLPTVSTFLNLKGQPVTLMQFIRELDERDSHPLLNDTALRLMKEWILNSIAIADPSAYKEKGITPPVAEDLLAHLDSMRVAVETFHRFLKTFISSGIWSTEQRKRLSKELEGLGITSIIVDRYGHRDE